MLIIILITLIIMIRIIIRTGVAFGVFMILQMQPDNTTLSALKESQRKRSVNFRYRIRL